MGRAVSSLIKRPVVNWNVENRAQKFLEKQKRPEVAPRHPSSKEAIDKFSKEHPEVLEEQAKKNTNLAKMLEGLVVTPEKFGEIISKKKQKLPEDRSKVPDHEFGYLEPETIRPGRCTIRQAMQFLGNHYSDPENFNASVIAKEYNLDKNHVNRVLQYFSVFLVQIPGQKTAELTDTSSPVQMRALKPSFFKKKLGSGTQDSSTDKLSHSNFPETK